MYLLNIKERIIMWVLCVNQEGLNNPHFSSKKEGENDILWGVITPPSLLFIFQLFNILMCYSLLYFTIHNINVLLLKNQKVILKIIILKNIYLSPVSQNFVNGDWWVIGFLKVITKDFRYLFITLDLKCSLPYNCDVI